MPIHKCNSCNIQKKKQQQCGVTKSMYVQNKTYVQKHRNGYTRRHLQQIMTVSSLLVETPRWKALSVHVSPQVLRVSVGSARPAAPRSRTRWLRCTAALCSTCSALGSSRAPASGAASAPAASAPACWASGPTAPSSPPGWFYTEFCRENDRTEVSTLQCSDEHVQFQKKTHPILLSLSIVHSSLVLSLAKN